MNLTQEDLWIGAAYLVSIRREDLMQPCQREVLGTFTPTAQFVADTGNDVMVCPLCVRRFPDPPFVFQGRWTGKWSMHSGPVGCPHADQKQFQTFVPTRAEVVERWNAWVKAQTPISSNLKSSVALGDSKHGAGLEEKKSAGALTPRPT